MSRHLILKRRYDQDNEEEAEEEEPTRQETMELSDNRTGKQSQSPTRIRGGKLKSLVGKINISRHMIGESVSDVNTDGGKLGSINNLSVNPFGGSKNALGPAGIRHIKTSFNGLQRFDTQGSDSGSRGKPSIQDLPIAKGDNMLAA